MKRRRAAWIWIALAILLLGIIGAATDDSSDDPPAGAAAAAPSPPPTDCRGGSGGGPDYTGPVRSVGSDPFDLDRDGDGLACETS